MLQKNRYDKILNDMEVNYNVPQEEFNGFMASLRTYRNNRP